MAVSDRRKMNKSGVGKLTYMCGVLVCTKLSRSGVAKPKRSVNLVYQTVPVTLAVFVTASFMLFGTTVRETACFASKIPSWTLCPLFGVHQAHNEAFVHLLTEVKQCYSQTNKNLASLIRASRSI